MPLRDSHAATPDLPFHLLRNLAAGSSNTSTSFPVLINSLIIETLSDVTTYRSQVASAAW
jgi:hypothetical protein